MFIETTPAFYHSPGTPDCLFPCIMSSSSRGRGGRGGGSAKKGAGRRNDNNKLYAHPLPLLLEPPHKSIQWATTILGIYGLSANRVVNPHCEGVFDPATRSVWVTNSNDSLLLWRRGFFGKGNLSRSEPSWLARQLNARKARIAGTTRNFCVAWSTNTLIYTRSLIHHPNIHALKKIARRHNRGRGYSKTSSRAETIQTGQSARHCCRRDGS